MLHNHGGGGGGGVSPQPPPVCRIHLDDATAAIDGDVRGSRNILSHHYRLTEAYGESKPCAGSGKIIAHLLNFLFSVSHEGSVVCVEQLTHKDALHPGSGPQTSQAEEVAITPGVQQNPTRIQKRSSQHSQNCTVACIPSWKPWSIAKRVAGQPSHCRTWMRPERLT